MRISIQGYSTALFSSWYFIEELGILFDAGDGVVSRLLQKSRKIKHVFITHPDRDHITGLYQLLQLNAFDGHLKVYYPKDSGSFPAMQAFINKFDPHVSACEWVPMDEGKIYLCAVFAISISTRATSRKASASRCLGKNKS